MSCWQEDPNMRVSPSLTNIEAIKQACNYKTFVICALFRFQIEITAMLFVVSALRRGLSADSAESHAAPHLGILRSG
jgi:hypothetical protein